MTLKEIQKYVEKLIPKLREEQARIGSLVTMLQRYYDMEQKFTADDFMKLVSDS